MKEIIEKFITTSDQEFHRYNSWNHCYTAFGDDKLSNETLALHLGFYLASWGMYRGSSGLLQKDFKIHIGAVQIIRKYPELRCSENNQVNSSNIKAIRGLIVDLKEYYQFYPFITLKGIVRHISATDTLISKILLGTLGCLPAFDRFFIDGVKEEKKSFTTLKARSLNNLFTYIEENREIHELQKEYPQYPIMKLIDMYFWQVGFDLWFKNNC